MTIVRDRLCAGAALLLAVATLSTGACTRDPDPTTPPQETSLPPGTDPDGRVVFPLPVEPAAGIQRAGLQVLGEQEPVVRYDVHLDIVVDGRPVAVPAGIGVERDPEGGPDRYSPVHTLDDSGVIHVTAERPETFRLAQVFQQWDVALSKDCIADFCADEDHQLLAFANGELVADPASIPLAAGLELVVWFGPKGSNPAVPTTYAFASTTTTAASTTTTTAD